MAKDCAPWFAWVLLVVGILFLLSDFGIWNFFGISWWSALFVLMGVGSLWAHK